jgi:hypothetical protein
MPSHASKKRKRFATKKQQCGILFPHQGTGSGTYFTQSSKKQMLKA